jgi:ribosome maturation factor RimP
VTHSGPGGGRPADVLIGLLTEPLAAAGFDLEEVAVRRAGARHVVVVAIDRDDAMDLDAVTEASRIVSEVLDADDRSLPPALRDAYTLEVASRGVDSPLTLPRHWRRAIGRLVQVRRRQAVAVTGRVLAASEDGAELDVAGKSLHVDYSEVAGALVQVEFNRPAADPGDVEEAR